MAQSAFGGRIRKGYVT